MAVHEIPVNFVITVDLDSYAEAYGIDPLDAEADATAHLAATARMAAAKTIFDLGIGAEVIGVGTAPWRHG